ncbi:GNAT family N-acetyltransferase [Roseovarius pacificus]|uniref:GNAT family N-acetyltransferase n=1 Tax=Roseovarius pacificus TaxID=337701 RepID=UPI00296823B5|nr:GNAT family N-acetyltransferase [Roseovarius pacificus]MDW3117117.1 GNAT family N-acetyltransferase [Roseovarius pacificus]
MSSLQILPASAACPADIDDLLERSCVRLLCADYPPDLLRAVLPVLGRARPELLSAAEYFVAVRAGRVVGAGGWSRETPFGRPGVAGLGHIRHVAVCPDHQRQGIGRALFGRIEATGQAAGVRSFLCLSTRNAVRFYGAMGFAAQGEVELHLGPGVYFPAVQMKREM